MEGDLRIEGIEMLYGVGLEGGGRTSRESGARKGGGVVGDGGKDPTSSCWSCVGFSFKP